MFGGHRGVPLTVRMILGRGWGQGPTQSQNLQAWFAHVLGLKDVALPEVDKYLRGSIQSPNGVTMATGRHGPEMDRMRPISCDQVVCRSRNRGIGLGDGRRRCR